MARFDDIHLRGGGDITAYAMPVLAETNARIINHLLRNVATSYPRPFIALADFFSILAIVVLPALDSLLVSLCLFPFASAVSPVAVRHRVGYTVHTGVVMFYG